MRYATALVLAAVSAAGCSGGGAPSDEFRLDNGLTVLLRPVEGAGRVALVVLFGIGGDHDPQGGSGLAHLIEHLYVTAAAGKTGARTTEEFVKRYPDGWNAQTGPDHTVIAVVFPPGGIEEELKDAAARMKDLRVTEADLRREKPRIRRELENMFERVPRLAAMNRAREKVRPTPRGGRKGGLPERIDAMTVKMVEKRLKKYYKPSNAVLVVAGKFDRGRVASLVEECFGPIPGGEPAPSPGRAGAPAAGGTEVVKAPRAFPETGRGAAAMAVGAPRPGEAGFAAFLVLAARLQSRATDPGRPPAAPRVFYPVLDDPGVLYLSAPLGPEEKPEGAAARLRRFLEAATERPFDEAEAEAAKKTFGFMLGLVRLPDGVLGANLYGLAYSLGRRRQLRLVPEDLAGALDALTAEGFRRAVAGFTAEDNTAVVVVVTGG